MRNIRTAALMAAWSAVGLLTPTAQSLAESSDKVGKTNYRTLTFQNQVFQTCWSCTQGMEPLQLFFQSNPNSRFLNAAVMKAAQQSSAALTAQGIVPMGGAQRWEDTWEASFPAGTFPGEPSWIQNDRTYGNYPNQPEFVAWRNFITYHPQYWDVAFDGGTMPNQANYFRSWGSQWGHLSPLTPLDQADCPPDMPNGCSWGDDWAYRWAQTSALSGGYGIGLSDFTDSQPAYENMLHDFNPRIIAPFAAEFGYTGQLNGMSATQAATWINANAYSNWTDFLSQGYAHFYNALATRMTKATSHKALVIDQCSLTPSWRRMAGTDQRIIAQGMDASSYLCVWDNHSIQNGRSGPIASPPMNELAGAVVAAARTPTVRNGANLEADDASYWAAIATFYPTLDVADQQEVGYKLLKRLWLWESWAHIATEKGHVRRALAMVARDYWDVGTLANIASLQTLIQTIRPEAPFGAALYYSTAVERAFEGAEAHNQPGSSIQPYLQWQFLQQFIDGGGGFGYYVSDISLPTISKAAGNAPSAWVVLDDPQHYLPSSELQALQSTAPVVNAVAALLALPNQPFLVTGGLTGFAFRDQNQRIIAVVSNPSTLPTATALGGVVTFSGLTAQSYTLTNLFNGPPGIKVTPVAGTLVLPTALNRWDTEVFCLTAN